MKDRIRALRKTFGLTQSEFGDKIGVKGNTITNYESGNRSISDAVILSICREYGCDETWLRTGEGEMFPPRSREEELAAYLGRLMNDPAADFQRRVISALSQLPPEAWEAFAAFIDKLTEEK